jgi:hypothetical protein
MKEMPIIETMNRLQPANPMKQMKTIYMCPFGWGGTG